MTTRAEAQRLLDELWTAGQALRSARGEALDERKHYFATEAALLDLLSDRSAVPTRENDLRMHWWLSHGCGPAALYGDDGEMQCSACMVDFKRLSGSEISAALKNARMLKRAALPSATGPRPWLIAQLMRIDGLLNLLVAEDGYAEKRAENPSFDEQMHEAIHGLKAIREFADMLGPKWKGTLAHGDGIQRCSRCNPASLCNAASARACLIDRGIDLGSDSVNASAGTENEPPLDNWLEMRLDRIQHNVDPAEVRRCRREITRRMRTYLAAARELNEREAIDAARSTPSPDGAGQ